VFCRQEEQSRKNGHRVQLMNELNRAKLAIKYIFFELIPIFFLGLVIFLFVLIMFQSFKLSEYIIVQGANFEIVAQILFYMTLGFLQILIPIALLFAILLVYGRMSNDSEILAFKSLGLNSYHLLIPALTLGIIITIISIQVSFHVAPWGQRQLDVLLNRLSQMRPGVTIREGVFSEGFFNLVVYANHIDKDSGLMKQVFIYDERDAKNPLTIIASEGEILKSDDSTGLRAFLRLNKGNIHKSTESNYTKIDFKEFDINLYDPHVFRERRTSANAMTMNEITANLNGPELKDKRKLTLRIEYHRRWALALTSIVFTIIGFSLGTVTNRRSVQSGSMVICVGAIVVYWILFAIFEATAKNQVLHPGIAAWATNAIFIIFGLYQFKKLAKQ
jgi:lipopolysaccharide export system permease protein